MRRNIRGVFLSAALCASYWPAAAMAQESQPVAVGLNLPQPDRLAPWRAHLARPSAAAGFRPARAFKRADFSGGPKTPASKDTGYGPSALAPSPLRVGEPYARGEVFGGFSYTNVRLPGLASRQHSVGWGASIAGYVNPYLGFAAEFAGQYDPECAENDVECLLEVLASTQIRDYSFYQFMAGPRVRVPNERFSPFFHALFGGVRSKVSLLDLITGARSETTSGPDFAMAFGGGLDWNLAPRFAVRLVQFDFIPVRDKPEWRHNFRYQAGVVIRFGIKE